MLLQKVHKKRVSFSRLCSACFQAGIAASNASYKQQQPGSNATSAVQLYAINMQFSNGQAQSDKINNMLLLSTGGGNNGASCLSGDQ
jgi:hypothetical protein